MITACLHCGTFHAASKPCPGSLALAIDDGPLGLGTTLASRYYIVSLVHQGGTSTVYRAQDDQRDGTLVAIKELRPAADASAADRAEAERWFAREAAISSALQHPLIPLFYSAFQEGSHSYLVQELIEGDNLGDLLCARGSLPERWVLAWGEALAGLLTYLHTLPDPVIYRDLKPENVVLRGHGNSLEGRELVLVDFGIARHFRPDEVGTTIGTPGFAPPEQYQGFASPQSDIYALGATLHRLLTSYDSQSSGSPFSYPDAHLLNPFVSKHTAAVLARALQMSPAARYTTAEEMRHALHEAHRLVTQIPTGTPLNMSLLSGDSTQAAITSLPALDSPLSSGPLLNTPLPYRSSQSAPARLALVALLLCSLLLLVYVLA